MPRDNSGGGGHFAQRLFTALGGALLGGSLGVLGAWFGMIVPAAEHARTSPSIGEGFGVGILIAFLVPLSFLIGASLGMGLTNLLGVFRQSSWANGVTWVLVVAG